MHETGCSGLVHWDDPEGWDVDGGGRGVQNRASPITEDSHEGQEPEAGAGETHVGSGTGKSNHISLWLGVHPPAAGY